MSNQPNVYFKDPETGEEYIGVPKIDLTVELLLITMSVVIFPISMSIVWFLINGKGL